MLHPRDLYFFLSYKELVSSVITAVTPLILQIHFYWIFIFNLRFFISSHICSLVCSISLKKTYDSIYKVYCAAGVRTPSNSAFTNYLP